jgi:hypothetical protein
MIFSYVRAPIEIAFDDDINFSGDGVVHKKNLRGKGIPLRRHRRDVIALFDDNPIVSGGEVVLLRAKVQHFIQHSIYQNELIIIQRSRRTPGIIIIIL